MKKLLTFFLIFFISLLVLAAQSKADDFKSDYIEISNIDKLAYVDLDGDKINEALLEAKGSVIKSSKETLVLIDGYLSKDNKHILNQNYNRIFGIFYKDNEQWLPTLLGAYSNEEHALSGLCLTAFEPIALLKSGKKQIKLNFSHNGEANGIDYYLFAFQNKKIDLLFHAWHDKYGGEVSYNVAESRIIDKKELYTPFQIPTHYYTSLWAYSVLEWNSQNNRFETEKEWMEWNKDFSLELDNGCGDNGKAIFEAQKKYKDGYEQWRSNPIRISEHYHPEFSGCNLIFNENGLAIVKGKTPEERIYLYQPFYRIEDKSIWEKAYYSKAGMMGIVPI